MVVEENVSNAGRSDPDLDSAAADSWPQRDFPIQNAGSGHVVQVVIKQSVLDAIHDHGQSRTDVEVCGVMVGQCYRDDRGPFVYIEAIIQGSHSDSRTAQVTFTAETWNHIQNEMDRRFDDKRILGWYHTHPGFGIFLSPMDMFIHENFFSADEQLAFVYDPLGGDEGLFVWRGGQAVQDQYQVENDPEANTVRQRQTSGESVIAAADRPDMEAINKRIAGLERRVRLLGILVYPLILLVLGWLLMTGFLMAVTKEYPLPASPPQPPTHRIPDQSESPVESSVEPVSESADEADAVQLQDAAGEEDPPAIGTLDAEHDPPDSTADSDAEQTPVAAEQSDAATVETNDG